MMSSRIGGPDNNCADVSGLLGGTGNLPGPDINLDHLKAIVATVIAPPSITLGYEYAITNHRVVAALTWHGRNP